MADLWLPAGVVDPPVVVSIHGGYFMAPYRRDLHAPIAHGYLTLSLLIPLWSQVLTVPDATMAVNYGLNKVRFPAPVPVGAKLRLTATLKNVEEVSGGLQVTVTAVIEREGGDKPVCIAEPVFRFFG